MNIFDNSTEMSNQPKSNGDYKVLEKILPNAIKYKEILSANKFTIVNVLGVKNGINLKVNLTFIINRLK